MNKFRYAVCFALIALTVGCSQESGVSDKSEEVTPKARGVIPQYQLDALEEAKKVEAVLKEAEEKRKREMEGI